MPILVIWPPIALVSTCPFLYIASTIKDFPILNTLSIGIAILFLIATISRLLLDLADRQSTLYTLTDTHLIKQTGIFNRDQTKIPLSKILGVKIQWALAGQILDYGNVIVLTAARTPIKLYDIPHPRTWEEEIQRRSA